MQTTRYEVFYCLLLGNASAIVLLSGRHIKYMVNICKTNLGICLFGFGCFFSIKEAFAVSGKVYDFSSACWPDGIIMFSPKWNSDFFPQRQKNSLQKMTAGSLTAGSFTYYSW